MTSLDRDLDRWLADLHAVEQQAAFQLRRAPGLVHDPSLAQDLHRHLTETLGHRDTLRNRLATRGIRPSPLLDGAVTVNRIGFLLYTALARDAPAKLLADSYAYEFLEIAAYRMPGHLAQRAGICGMPTPSKPRR